MRHIRWPYTYKKTISRVLILALFIQPIVFISRSNVAHAQTNPASSTYSGDGTSFSGISQWGQSGFVNNPDIAKALKSCTQVVPSFQKKVVGLFKQKKQLQTQAIATDQIRSGISAGGSSCGKTGLDKFNAGNANGLNKDESSVLTQAEKDACDSSKTDSTALLKASSLGGDIVSAPEAEKQLEEIAALLKKNNVAVSGTQEAVEGTKIRNECMDSIAFAMTKQALAGLTESTVNWINTGNWDDPYYIKEPTQFFNNLKGQTLKQTLGNLFDEVAQQGAQADYPFLGTTYKALLTRYAEEDFATASRSTLGDVLVRLNVNRISGSLFGTTSTDREQAVRDFERDFNNGGWAGWLELTQKDQNNPWGSAFQTDKYLSDKIASKEADVNKQLDNGQGFLSQTKCVEQYIPEQCIEYMDDRGQFVKATDVTTSDLALGIYTCSKTQPAHTTTRGITAKPTDATCTKTEVVTPGSIIAERMKFAATTDMRQLELADQFNQSLSAVFTAAFTRLQTEGLAGLSKEKYGDWSAQARRQTFLEKYNSQYKKTGAPGEFEAKQLIIRRPATGYSSGDFDITMDLFDQQIGCVVQPGIVTTQENYIKELKKSSGPSGPLLRIVPAMSELDYCVPGPTSNWEEISDTNFELLYNVFADQLFYYSQDQNAQIETSYAAIGKKIQEYNVQRARAETNAERANIAFGAAGLLLSSGVVAGLLVAAGVSASTANPVGAAIAVGLLITAGVWYLFAKKKEKAAKAAEERYVAASDDFLRAAEWSWETDAQKWRDEQITNLIQDYNLFKQETYAKYSDANSIPVAAKARPFINSLPSYSANSFTLLSDYQKEIKDSEQDLVELKQIQAEVKRIKDDATARAKKAGLPTDVPDACKPTALQCPAKVPGRSFLITDSSVLSSVDFVKDLNQGLVSGNTGPGTGTVSLPVFEPPEISMLGVEYTILSGRTTIKYKKSGSVLSVLASCSSGLTNASGVQYNNTEVYSNNEEFFVDGLPNVGQSCTLIARSPDGGGGVQISPPKRCVFTRNGITLSCQK